MKRWLLRSAVVVVVLLFLGLVWRSVFEPEPRYEGKTVSEWFEKFCLLPFELTRLPSAAGTTNRVQVTIMMGRAGRELRPMRLEAMGFAGGIPRSNYVAGWPLEDPPMAALLALGPAAIPHLVAQLERKPTFLDRGYARVFYKAPRLFRRILPVPPNIPTRQYNAALALSGLGTNAQPAVPALVRLLPDADALLKSGLIHALRNLDFEKEALLPALKALGRQAKYKDMLPLVHTFQLRSEDVCAILIPAVTNSDLQIRLDTLRALEGCGPLAGRAVPVLMSTLGDPEREVRYMTARTLEAIGTNAAAAVPALEAARADPETIVSNAVARALKKVSPQMTR